MDVSQILNGLKNALSDATFFQSLCLSEHDTRRAIYLLSTEFIEMFFFLQ